jgi:hypothetical protein
VRRFVDGCTIDALRQPKTWTRLRSIVQVRPNDDIFPVRAAYEPDQPATIGVNHLRSREPMWFTLADVLAAKVLGGKAPEIVAAVQFAPYQPQRGLRTISLEGTEIRPEVDDFYKLLIDQRQRIQQAVKVASKEEEASLVWPGGPVALTLTLPLDGEGWEGYPAPIKGAGTRRRSVPP